MSVQTKTNSTVASDQWANRPADQRFWDLPEMLAGLRRHEENTVRIDTPVSNLRVCAESGNRLYVEAIDQCMPPITPTSWAFNQLCQSVKAPAGFLSTLPAEKAADILNYRIKQMADQAGGLDAEDETDTAEFRPSQAIIHTDGDTRTFLGLTSQGYGIIPNSRLVECVMNLPGGWKLPPARPNYDLDASTVQKTPATMWDPTVVKSWSAEALMSRPRVRFATQRDVEGINPTGLGIPVKAGDVIAPAGAYGSEKEIFLFMVDPSKRVENDGMARGFILRNSTVGAASFNLWMFYLEAVCGNHIMFGVKSLMEIRIRHTGDGAVTRAIDGMQQKAKMLVDRSAVAEDALFSAAAKTLIGDTEDEVVQTVFNNKIFSRRFAKQAYAHAHTARELGQIKFDPRSVRGMVYGATAESQKLGYTDARTTLDRATGALFKTFIDGQLVSAATAV